MVVSLGEILVITVESIVISKLHDKYIGREQRYKEQASSKSEQVNQFDQLVTTVTSCSLAVSLLHFTLFPSSVEKEMLKPWLFTNTFTGDETGENAHLQLMEG